MDMWEGIRNRKKVIEGMNNGQHSLHSYIEIHNETSDFVQLLHANNKIQNLQCIAAIVFEIYKVCKL